MSLFKKGLEGVNKIKEAKEKLLPENEERTAKKLLSKEKDDLIDRMLITTTDSIPGTEIIGCVGIVMHNSMLKSSFNEGFLKDFKKKAVEQGANAIVGMQYIGGATSTLIGTGVIIDSSTARSNSPSKASSKIL